MNYVSRVERRQHTMELDSRIKALIAVGASITANCQPCLKSTVAMALECGASEQEIAEAIEIGKGFEEEQPLKWTSLSST
jgi:AhpD family alkylhydroperoxidase